MDALIFVDTNIYLDFYRARGGDSALSLLDHLGSNVSRIISTSQVEMEFLKNRQDVIIESLRGIKAPEWQLAVPALFAQAKHTKALDARRKDVDKHLKSLRSRVEAVLRAPRDNDPVFRKVLPVFRHSGPYMLGRTNDARATIRRLAWKRFILGYPPRKERDTSIGDATNWEWMLRCVSQSGKHLIIVSRDSDYGKQYSKTPIVNDWLNQEFRERISSRRKLVLTDRLSEAFKLIAAPVSKKEEASEAALIADVKSGSSLARPVVMPEPGFFRPRIVDLGKDDGITVLDFDGFTDDGIDAFVRELVGRGLIDSANSRVFALPSGGCSLFAWRRQGITDGELRKAIAASLAPPARLLGLAEPASSNVD